MHNYINTNKGSIEANQVANVNDTICVAACCAEICQQTDLKIGRVQAIFTIDILRLMLLQTQALGLAVALGLTGP